MWRKRSDIFASIVAGLGLVCGCAGSHVEPFQPLSSPLAINGVYRNASRNTHSTLWSLAGTGIDGPTDGGDRDDDTVNIAADDKGVVTFTLLRDGRAVAVKAVTGFVLHDSDRLLDERFTGKDSFLIVLWLSTDDRRELGLSADPAGPPALQLYLGRKSLPWLGPFPVLGSDSVVQCTYLFDAVARPATRPAT